MAYDYGSSGIEVANPFRLEGALSAVRGVVTTILGIVLLLSLRQQVLEPGSAAGRVKLLGAVAILGWGLSAVGWGLFRVFRFYVGRGIPLDLADTGNAQHRSVHQPKPVYPLNDLKDMLMSRINRTYFEPSGWLPRLLHSLVGNMLFLTPPLRKVAQSMFETGVVTLGVILLFGLALFSAATGLVPIRGTPVASWIGWIFVATLFGVLWHNLPTLARMARRRYSGATVVWAISWAILGPTILLLIQRSRGLPVLTASPVQWLLLLAIGAVVICLSCIWMVVLRMPADAPKTEVSEYRDQWQESVHPMDIFRCVELTMADFRFQEIPNRIYDRHNPHLVDDTKGDFSGSVIQETQPIPQPVDVSPALDRLRKVNLIAGQGLLLAGTVCFFVLSARVLDPNAPRLELLMSGLIFILFGIMLRGAALFFFGEVRFESRLVHFFTENGTFSRSKLSTGMGIHDSTRSENEVVRSSLTPWMLCTRLQTLTFAVSGAHNLEQRRYVVEMSKDDAFLESVVRTLRHFIQSRQIMAGLTADGDFAAAGAIHRVNQVTRAPGEPLVPLPEDRRPHALPAPGAGAGR
jgi:hypothetical protein